MSLAADIPKSNDKLKIKLKKKKLKNDEIAINSRKKFKQRERHEDDEKIGKLFRYFMIIGNNDKKTGS